MKRRAVLAFVSMAFVAAPWLTGTAGAASSCEWDAGSATLTVTVDGTAGLEVSGTDILLDGDPCVVGATTDVVDTIEIVGTAGNDGVVLQHEGGPFAPGAEDEPGGTPEIEITVALGAGDDDLIVNGGPDQDAFSLGTAGANLDADDDVDLTFTGVEEVQLLGQEEDDTLSASGDGVVGAGFSGGLIVGGGAGNDSITGGPTGDLLIGGDDSDFLLGLGGVDVILGGAGGDLLRGGALSDDLDGGTGSDTVDYADAPAKVTVDLVAGASGASGADDLVALEHVVGSPFADRIFGTGGPNELSGGAGNDLINGRGGADTMDGGGGPRDLVSFIGAPSAVTASLQNATATGWGSDSLFGFERIEGSTRNDHLTGSGGADELLGGAGNDTLRGLGGADRLRPGPGNDTVRGEAGRDTLDVTAATRCVTIDLAAGTSTGEGADALSGIENALGSRFGDRLSGNAAANTLTGRDGADVLVGRDGPDELRGNGGNDTLNGGPGVDTCVQGAGSGPMTACEAP